MPIINLTNVTVRITDETGDVYRTFEPDDRHLRVQSAGEEREVDGVPIEETTITATEGLPDPEDGTYFIVPQPVAQVTNRPDFVTPDTGPSAVRKEDGSVYAVRRLFRVRHADA